MSDLLLEIFSEEIPARMQEDAIAHLKSALEAGLKKGGITPTSAKSYVTPRRLAVWLCGLPAAQEDVSTELKGPKVDAPQAALDGFLKKTGLSLEQLEKRDGVYFAVVEQKGKPTAQVLKPLIEDIMASFPWPKSMRWGSRNESWVRPLHSILCLFDGQVLPVEFAGVKASSTTRGHRFLSKEVLTITNPEEYAEKLKKAHVMADRQERKDYILQGIDEKCRSLGLKLKTDEGLLEEVTGLVEWPVPLVGTIDAKYMDLPKEVLVSEMRAHQKYFALENADGSLSDKFIIISNMITGDSAAIVAGNERVLRARLSDGRFFWDQDRKKKLADWAEGLKAVTYHAKLGSIADKVSRIEKLAEKLAAIVPGADKAQVVRAAALAKADLVTGMVGEFAELQGVMGRYYAQGQGETASVADAIRDHYKPQGPGDSVPGEATAICVALADKLDTLSSMFAIGEKPTGSKDPFALRRAALGIIRIVLENNIRLNLGALLADLPLREIALHKAHDKLKKQAEAALDAPHKVGKYLTVNESASEDVAEDAQGQIVASLLAFFADRLKVQLKDQGIRHDVIAAVMEDGDDDLVRIVARAKALQDFIATDDGKNLLAAYKRAANILSIEEKKDKTSFKAAELSVSSLKEEAEQQLAKLLAEKAPQIAAKSGAEQFSEAMKLLASLRPAVDLFFDKIMVNADDKNLRENRLKLLATIRDNMNKIANFAAIEG